MSFHSFNYFVILRLCRRKKLSLPLIHSSLLSYRAHCGEGRLRGRQRGMVQTEENHCRVDENAADEGDVAQLGTGKFYRSVDVPVSVIEEVCKGEAVDQD